MLEQADPRVGSTVKTSPHTVTLTFSQKLEGAFSSIRVLDAKGARVDAGKAQVDPADSTVLRIGVKTLAPGTYKVQWRALSVDTHTTEGSFSFTVAP
jgi:methionine-rich copper-binding protein CopC